MFQACFLWNLFDNFNFIKKIPPVYITLDGILVYGDCRQLSTRWYVLKCLEIY